MYASKASLLICSGLARTWLSSGVEKHAVAFCMQCKHRRNVARKGLVNKAIHLGCSLGSFVLHVGSRAQVFKHDNLAWKPLPRRLPCLPKMGRLGDGSAPRTLCTEEGAVVSTFGWTDTVSIYWPRGCSLARAAAVCLAEVAVRTGGWGEELTLLRGASRRPYRRLVC